MEKGVEFFYEMMMYSILLCFPLYELYRAGDDGEKKNEKLNKKLEILEEDVQSIHRSIDHQSKNVEKKITEMKKTIEVSHESLIKNKLEMSESCTKSRKLFNSSFNDNIELFEQMKQEKMNFEDSVGVIESKNLEIIDILRKISQNPKPAALP